MSLGMAAAIWEYWSDKKGTRDACAQYPAATQDAIIAAAIADYDRAHAALAAVMAKWCEEHTDT